MTNWPQVAGRMRSDVDRSAINERARMVLSLLIKVTLVCGRVQVKLPDRSGLCELLKIRKSHMKKVWLELESANVVRFKKVDGGWQIVLNPDSGAWMVGWVYARSDEDAFRDFVERTPGQAQGGLWSTEPNLTQAVAELGAEKAGSYQKGNSVGPAVTKLVTPSRGPCTDTSTSVKPVLKRTSKAGLTDVLVNREYNPSTLYNRLQTFFGSSPYNSDRNDLAAWGGHWRNIITGNPEKFSMCLKMLEDDVHEGREATRSRVAWLKDLLKR